jgi:hypothetical protein
MQWMLWREENISKEGCKVLELINDSLSNHLNGRIKCKKAGPQGVLTKQEDEAMVTWILNMQKVRLSINIQ